MIASAVTCRYHVVEIIFAPTYNHNTDKAPQTSPPPNDLEGQKCERFSFRAAAVVRTTSPADTLTTIPNTADLGTALPPMAPSILRHDVAIHAYIADCNRSDNQPTEVGVVATRGNVRLTSIGRQSERHLPPTKRGGNVTAFSAR